MNPRRPWHHLSRAVDAGDRRDRRRFLKEGAAALGGAVGLGALLPSKGGATAQRVTALPRVITGTKPPSARRGKPGDFYVDTVTHQLYGPKLRAPRGHNGWGRPLSLVALTGPAGPRGTGATGVTGATGASGTNGLSPPYSVLGGTGPPSSSVGADGDFFIDIATAQVYGPRSSGSWGSPVSITGPTAGEPGGLATLNGNGTLAEGQLPASVVSNGAWIDICKLGALPGEDITTLLTDAIGEVIALGGGTAFIGKPGTYLIHGPQISGSAHGGEYSGQVLFPASSVDPAPSVTIKGCVPLYQADWNPVNGVTLQTNATSGSVFDVIPALSGLYVDEAGYSNLLIRMEDFVLETPENPLCNGVRSAHCPRIAFKNFVVRSAGEPTGFGSATATAIIMPPVSSAGSCLFENVCIYLFPIGMKMGEHGIYNGVYIGACAVAIEGQPPGGGHVNAFVMMDVEDCGTVLKADGAYGFKVDGLLDWQADQSGWDAWLGPHSFIDDPIGAISGVMRVHLASPGEVRSGVPQLGGLYLDVVDLDLGAQGWKGQYPMDTFVRHYTYNEDGAAPGRASSTPHPWFVNSGSFAITQQSGFGELNSTAAAGESFCRIPIPNTKVSKVTRCTMKTGNSGAFWFGVQVAWAYGGPENRLELSCRHDKTWLKRNDTTLGEFAALSPATEYSLTMALYYTPAGLPEKMVAYVNGVEEIAHTFTPEEQGILKPGTDPVIPIADGLIFYSDVDSTCTHFEVAKL